MLVPVDEHSSSAIHVFGHAALTIVLASSVTVTDTALSGGIRTNIFVRHGRPTVLDCERLRKTWAVRKNTGLKDGAWPAPYWINHRKSSFYLGEAIPRFREESKVLRTYWHLRGNG